MKNKKGEELLGPEIVKIILAVIGIVILIALAVKLYGMSKKVEPEQAEASLDIMYLQVAMIESGEKQEAEVLIESPNKWWVVAWPYGEGDEKPIQCKKDYCICICPDDSLEDCNSGGFCKDVDKKIKVGYDEEPLEIEGPISLTLKLQEEEILIFKTG